MTSRVLVAAGAAALLSAVFALNAASKMPDFEVYWRAGARALAAEPLYRAADGHYQLKYLPAFAVLSAPIALIPLPAAKALWFAGSALLVWAVLAASAALLPDRHKPRWVLITATLVAMAKFYGHELVLGQVNVLLAALVLTGVRDLQRGRAVRAGLLTALAVVVKPYAAILLPWLAAQRAGAAAATAAAGTAAALLLPVPLYGWEDTIALHRAWWSTAAGSTAPNLLNADNVSLAGMFAKWIGPGQAASAMTAAASAALLVAAGVVVARRRSIPAPAALEAGLLLTLIPLLSPQGWDYVFLLSTPAVMCLINYERKLPTGMRAGTWTALAVVAFSIYDVMGRRAYAAFMGLSIITVCYLVLVASLVTLRLRRAA